MIGKLDHGQCIITVATSTLSDTIDEEVVLVHIDLNARCTTVEVKQSLGTMLAFGLEENC